MRYAVFGDIHGNLDALDAVLADLAERQIDRYLCVGDIVGYGAEPTGCVKRVRELGAVCVSGNHDQAAIGRLDVGYFNVHAREAIGWTRQKLSIASVEFLAAQPLVKTANGLTLAHGTIHQPESFGYIETVFSAQLSFHAMHTRLAFLGHSHVPITFLETGAQDTVTYTQSTELELRHVSKAIVNVGSVGQPRDDDPRACYAVYDSDEQTAVLRRIEYDVAAAQEKIRAAGLPEILASRLAEGR